MRGRGCRGEHRNNDVIAGSTRNPCIALQAIATPLPLTRARTGQPALANVPRGGLAAGCDPLLLLYFAKAGCPILALRRGSSQNSCSPVGSAWRENWGRLEGPNASARAMQAQGGAARPGEIKEEKRAKAGGVARTGDIRRDGLPRPGPDREATSTGRWTRHQIWLPINRRMDCGSSPQ